MDTKKQIAYLMAAGISQGEIAQEIGVTQPYISMIFSGIRTAELRYSTTVKLNNLVRKQQRKDKRKVSA